MTGLTPLVFFEVTKFFTGKSDPLVFLGSYFFSPSKPDFSTQQRALILIHEAVHNFAKKSDKAFIGGSKGLSKKIAGKCFPGLNAAKLLGDLTL